MSQEAIQILKELHNSGQIGVLILIVALLVIIAASIWMIWQQKRSIALIKDSQGVIDQKLKSADSLREESRKSQEMNQKEMTDRIDSLVKINNDLRTEVERFDKKQVEFQKVVKEAIDLGINDLKGRINQVTVGEIIEGIPKGFRIDLEAEMMKTSERVLNQFLIELKKLPDNIMHEYPMIKAIDIIAHSLERKIEYYFGQYARQVEINVGYHQYHLTSEELVERLAQRILYLIIAGKYGQVDNYLLTSEELVERLAQRIEYLIRR
jgi:hypothetical protein